MLDLLVESRLRLRIAWIGQDRAVAQRARASLHAALEPANDLTVRNLSRRERSYISRPAICHATRVQSRFNLCLGELGPQKDVVSFGAWQSKLAACHVLGCTERGARIGAGRRREEFLEWRLEQDP